MSFFSIEFLLIFFVFFVAYNFLDTKKQNALLLCFNMAFLYLINPYFLIIVFAHSFFIHFFALSIYTRKTINSLFTALFFIVCNLCFFKFYASLKDSFDLIFSFLKLDIANVVFPLGISFYTFNSITYLVLVYKEKKEPVKFLTLFIYLSFFVTFISGPIFRFNKFYEQYNRLKRFKHKDLVISNLLLALIKIFLLLPIIDKYFYALLDELDNLSIVGLLNCFYLYSIKLYFDFSAYINFVTALGLIIGFKLPKNFNNPFKSVNIKDFWRRWHISLSSFIRDFIYIPLGGNKNNKTYRNILIAFAISGIWHGNTINFLIWGIAHALGLIFISKINFNFNKLLSAFITFTYISVIWSFFYFDNFADIKKYFLLFLENNAVNMQDMIIFYIILFLFIVNFYSKNHLAIITNFFRQFNIFIKIIIINIVLLVVFIYMPNGIPNFIYAGF